jgi:hypothetical protein
MAGGWGRGIEVVARRKEKGGERRAEESGGVGREERNCIILWE